MDFGFAVVIPPASEYVTLPAPCGTPFYAAPEVIYQLRVYFQSDIYTLGHLAVALAGIRVPFLAEGISERDYLDFVLWAKLENYDLRNDPFNYQQHFTDETWASLINSELFPDMSDLTPDLQAFVRHCSQTDVYARGTMNDIHQRLQAREAKTSKITLTMVEIDDSPMTVTTSLTPIVAPTPSLYDKNFSIFTSPTPLSAPNVVNEEETMANFEKLSIADIESEAHTPSVS